MQCRFRKGLDVRRGLGIYIEENYVRTEQSLEKLTFLPSLLA